MPGLGPGIQAFLCISGASCGCRACARHDVVEYIMRPTASAAA